MSKLTRSGVTLLLTIMTLATAAQEGVVLDAFSSVGNWTFDNGQEFPGAIGNLSKVKKAPVMTISYDFSKGGAYVQAIRKSDLPAGTKRISFQAQADADSRITLRVIVGKRCYQSQHTVLKARKVTPVIIDLQTPFPEAWGGSDDNKIPTGQITGIAMVVSGQDNKVGMVGIWDLRVVVQP
jgi:hypothetical protein